MSELACITLPSGITITGGGQGVTSLQMFTNSVGAERFVLANQPNAVAAAIRSLTIDGNRSVHPYNEHKHGLFLKGCTGLTISDVEFVGAWGDGIFVYDDVYDLTITNCYFHDNWRSGIAFNGLIDGVLIEDCVIIGRADQGIDSEPSGGSGRHVDNVTVRNCILSMTTGVEFTVAAGGRASDPNRGWHLDGCTITDGSVQVIRSADFVMSGCEVTPHLSTAVFIERRVDSATFTNNTLHGNMTVESYTGEIVGTISVSGGTIEGQVIGRGFGSLTLNGVTIDGAGTSGPVVLGEATQAIDELVVTGCHFSNVGGRVVVQASGGTAGLTSVTVTNCTYDGTAPADWLATAGSVGAVTESGNQAL